LLNDTSKTVPTHNEKILIAQEVHDDYELVNYRILDLLGKVQLISDEEVVAAMKIVPEFKSMNSVFENLDS
jgi:hypothetical protein